MELSEKIKEFRILKQLSQEELAEKLNIPNQIVSKWDNGFAIPDIDNISVLSKIFGVTADDLLETKETAKKDEKSKLVFFIKIGFVCILLALTGLIGQYLLYLLKMILIDNDQGYTFGTYICFSLTIVGVIFVAVSKSVLRFELKENYTLAIYKTTTGKIGLISLAIACIMFAAVFYSFNKFIALICFLFWLIGNGLCIFAAINNKTSIL